MRDISTLPSDAVLRMPDLLELTGICKASIYAKAREQRFPAPIKLTHRASGWRVADVRAWLADPLGWSPPTDDA